VRGAGSRRAAGGAGGSRARRQRGPLDLDPLLGSNCLVEGRSNSEREVVDRCRSPQLRDVTIEPGDVALRAKRGSPRDGRLWEYHA